MSEIPASAAENLEPAALTAGAPPAVAELSPAACAARLAELFPALFGAGAAKPLKLRIQADIQQRAPGVFTKKSLSVFLHRHTTGTAYLKAMVSAPERVDLDGLPAGPVADEHRQAATAELQRRRASHDERRAAERDAAREAGRKAQNELREAGRKAQDEAREAHRKTQEAAHAAQDEARRVQEEQGQGRAERAALLRAYESTTLTRSNFCALKRIAETDLDAALAQARQDRERQAQALRSQPAVQPERPQAGPGDREPRSVQRRPPPRRPQGPPKPSE